MQQNNIPGLLFFIDFEKAFDSAEWSFVNRTLEQFGFYNNIESCVLNNGWSSNFFKLQRDVWQRCPQPLVQLRISVIFLVLNLMTRKLKPYGSGRWWVRKKNFYLKRILNGLKKKVKVLGAWISTDSAVTLKLNYTEKVDKIRNILSCWEYRRLTLIGRIQVIKSLALSQLTYILTPLATNQNFINEINDTFYSFVWNNKGDKVKRTILINKYENGGLKMVDLSWIQKYLDTSNHGKWKEFVELELGKYGGSLIFKSNLNKTDSLKTISVKNNFTRELLEIWAEFNFEDVIKTKQQFLE